jgi:hypothetical protein
LGGRPGDKPDRFFTKPGEATSIVIGNRDSRPLVIRGTGALAPGLIGDVLTESDRRRDRGLSSVACAEPNADAWFAGGGSAVGRESILYLSNAESSPATVDVDVYSREGLVDAPAGRGIVVPANRTRRVSLDALAPGAGPLAVRVRVSSGRVSSALRDGLREGLQPRGSDYVPQATAPARRIVIPGLVGGPGTRTISLLAPGDADATVSIRVLGRDEDFAPEGGDVVQVPAGRLVRVDLSRAIGAESVTLVVDSDEPVTGGVLVRRTRSGDSPDFAWAAAAGPVAPVGAVATSRVGGSWKAFLMLAAPDADAVVDLRVGAPGGRLATERIEIPAGRVRVISLGRADDPVVRGVMVLPVQGSGPVHAARMQQLDGATGVAITSLPLSALRVEVAVPEAAPDLSAGLGGAAR